MIIAEPVTLLTDYALAGVSGWLGWRLSRSLEGHAARRLWTVAFLALAAAAALGGTYHGSTPHLGESASGLLWKLTVIAIGVFSFGMMAGSACATTHGALRRALLAAAGLQLAVYSAWMLTHDEYRYVVIDTAISMGALIVLHSHMAVSRRDVASCWILGGVGASALGATAQLFHVALHEHFNHNDLYHVVQIAAMTLFYRGGKLLRDEVGTAST